MHYAKIENPLPIFIARGLEDWISLLSNSVEITFNFCLIVFRINLYKQIIFT